ncbi:MAG TPA: peptidylprolyl isomerase [Blastocatellia bacterium]|nr:peptidylprolyl isomerase [Blastocatellia bacterium]
MKLSGRVIVMICVVVMLGGFGLIAQWACSTPPQYKLTAHDMEILVGEIIPPGQQQQLASDGEQRKKLAKEFKKVFSLAQVAEREGFAEHPDIKSQIDIDTDVVLRDAWEKKNAGATVTDEEVAAYHQAHPNEWTSFLDVNPQFKTQAQGPQGEGIKKEFGQIKLLAERARKAGLDDAETIKLRVMWSRSLTLATAYFGDLQKNADKLVNDADVEQYYNEHREEFEEVRARHILISTRPPEESPAMPAGKDKDKKDADTKPKALTKDEARKKAQSILDRVRKGEDFGKLAEANSDDPGSKVKGGDLGFFAKGTMVGAFDNAAFAMKPGDISDLVETEFGFHIIKVEERHTKSLDDPQAKQQITEKVKRDKLQKRVDDITASSKVDIPEEFTINPKPSTQLELPSPASSGGSTPEGAPPSQQ